MSSSSEEAEFDGEEAFEQEQEDEASSSEEDEPLSNLKKSPSPAGRQRASIAAKKKPSYKEEETSSDGGGSSSSDDDDAPLSSLVAKKKPAAAAAKVNGSTTNNQKTVPKKKESPQKKKAASTKKPPLKKTSSSVSNGNNNNIAPTTNSSATGSSAKSKSYEWASAALYGSECEKGMLIQRLLCRWWYAFEWPDPKTLPAQPPDKYDALDGFPGVYIGTAAENVGHIQDLRNAQAAPTFVNFARKSSEELRDWLVTALQQQTQQLVAAEGPGTATEKELATLLKWAKKVNVAKADKEAAKVLKAQGLSLDSFEL